MIKDNNNTIATSAYFLIMSTCLKASFMIKYNILLFVKYK